MPTVKHGDTHITTWQSNLNLTGATVRLLARPRRGVASPTTLAATVVDAVSGTVTHKLTGTLEVGEYAVEMEVTYGDGTIITAPNGNPQMYETLKVVADLR